VAHVELTDTGAGSFAAANSPNGEDMRIDRSARVLQIGSAELRHWCPDDLHFAKDGRWIVSAGCAGLRVFDTHSGQRLAAIRFAGGCSSATSIYDGRLLVCSTRGDFFARLVDPATWSVFKVRDYLGAVVRGVPGKPIFVSTDRGECSLRVWDADERRLIARADDLPEAGTAAVSADGSTIVLAGDACAVWRLSPEGALSREFTHAPKEAKLHARSIALSHALVAVGNWNGTIVIFELERNGSSMVLEAHRGAVTSLTFSPRGNVLYSGSDDGMFCCWDVSNGRPVDHLTTEAAPILAMDMSPDGKRLACASKDGRIALFDVSVTWSVAQFPVDEAAVSHPVYSPDGRVIASSGGPHGGVRIWRATDGELVCTLADRLPHARCCFADGGRHVVAVQSDGTVGAWETGMWSHVAQYKLRKGNVCSLTASPTGRWIATTHRNDSALIWAWGRGGPESLVCTDHSRGIGAIAFAPDEHTVATLSELDCVSLFNLEMKREISRFRVTCLNSDAMSISSQWELALIANTGHGVLELWDLHTVDQPRRKWRRRLRNEHDSYCAVAFSPDGMVLAYAVGEFRFGKCVIHLARSADGARLATLEGHEHWINALQFSPDGERLLSGSVESMAMVWDVRRILG
jgi:WD40 repeat protein